MKTMKKEKVIGISTFAKIKTGNLMIEDREKTSKRQE